MTQVNFKDYLPVERFDNLPWIQLLVYESSTSTGPWVLLSTINLNPVDADPAHPQARNFTINNATLEHGWYKMGWKDASGQIVETVPIQNVASIPWRPSLQDVGKIDMARTRNDVGVNIGTFNAKTQPTDDQVQPLIDKSVRDLIPVLGTDIPASLIQQAQDLAAIRTAMYIELSFFGTEIAQNRSPFQYFRDMYKEKRPEVISEVESVEAGGDETDALALGTTPAFGFPASAGWLDRAM